LLTLTHVMDMTSVCRWARPCEEHYIPVVSVRQQGSAKISVVPTCILDYLPAAHGSG